MEWRSKGSRSPRNFKAVRRSSKVLASIVWDCEGIMVIDYLQKGKMSNGQYYEDELVRFTECTMSRRKDEES